MRIVFVDCETTGLDPTRHVPWEIALALPDGTTRTWLVPPSPVQLQAADPGALRISRFYERCPRVEYVAREAAAHRASDEIAALTANAILAGNCVSFDAAMLESFLRAHYSAPAWHYHLLDVEVFAAGALGLSPPWNSKSLSESLAVAMPSEAELHTALGDAVWAKRMYEAALARKS